MCAEESTRGGKVSTRRQQIADWACQLGVSEEALIEFLEESSSLELESAKETQH